MDGGWGSWGLWSSCSVTCGVGVKNRTRLCNNPSPKYKGYECPGIKVDEENCFGDVEVCPSKYRQFLIAKANLTY